MSFHRLQWQLKQPVPTLSWLMLEGTNPVCDVPYVVGLLLIARGEAVFFSRVD